MAEVAEENKTQENTESKTEEGEGGAAPAAEGSEKQSIAERKLAEKEAESEAPVSEEENQENMSQVLKLVDQYPSLTNDDDFKKLKEARDNIIKKEASGEKPEDKKPEGTETKEGEKPEGKKEEEKPEDKKPEDKKAEGAEGDEESTFFNKTQKSQDIKIADEEEAKKYVKDVYAIDIENPEDWGKFFKATNGWRTDSQQQTELKEKYDGLISELGGLPQPIYEAIKEFGVAGNWQKAFMDSVGSLDMAKNFDAHSKEGVMKAYFPTELKEINASEAEADEKQKQIDKYYNSAQRLYDRDQEIFESQRVVAVEQSEQASATRKSSVDTSVSKLREAYPGFSDDMLNRVKGHLANNTLVSLFLNKDGSYKEDAAKSLAFALFGEQELQRKIEKVKRETKSKTTEEVVSRKNEEPPKKGTQEQPVKGEVKETVKKYTSLFQATEDPYASEAPA